MSVPDKIVILLIGRTGDGKSTVGNEILKVLKYDGSEFSEGKGVESHTHDPKCVVADKYVIVDNPGLMDTKGEAKDEQNIKKIVENARKLGHLNMLLLVVNAAAPRFDHGMQMTVKVIADSFGKQSLTRLFVVFTNIYGHSNDLEHKSKDLLDIINSRCEVTLGHLTFYATENHPENFEGLSSDYVKKLRDQSLVQLTDLTVAAANQEMYSTEYAVFGEYDHVKNEREAKERADKEARLRAVAEEQRRLDQQRADREAFLRQQAEQQRREENRRNEEQRREENRRNEEQLRRAEERRENEKREHDRRMREATEQAAAAKAAAAAAEASARAAEARAEAATRPFTFTSSSSSSSSSDDDDCVIL